MSLRLVCFNHLEDIQKLMRAWWGRIPATVSVLFEYVDDTPDFRLTNPGRWSDHEPDNVRENMEDELLMMESILSGSLTEETYAGMMNFLRATLPDTPIDEIQKALVSITSSKLITKAKCSEFLPLFTGIFVRRCPQGTVSRRNGLEIENQLKELCWKKWWYCTLMCQNDHTSKRLNWIRINKIQTNFHKLGYVLFSLAIGQIFATLLSALSLISFANFSEKVLSRFQISKTSKQVDLIFTQ